MGKVVRKKIKSYSSAEVLKTLHIGKQELKNMEAEGIFEFADAQKKRIDEENFKRLKVAATLKSEFGVNDPGIDIILSMLDKITFLQNEYSKLSKNLDQTLTDEHEQNLKRLKEAIDSTR